MAKHVITLFKVQTSKKEYLRAACSPFMFSCWHTVACRTTGGIRDPKLRDFSCGIACPTQNVCLMPDTAEVYIGTSSKGLDPLINVVWDLTPPNIKCSYDLDNIDTPAQINALKRLFPNEQVAHVMRAFCTKKSTNCQNGRSTCSMLNDVSEAGSMCREWLGSLPSDAARDSVRREYCYYNDTDDCKCINRTQHADFNDLRAGMDARLLSSTRCWYKPCEDNSNLLLDVEQKQECIANVCQNIIDAHAQGNIDISNNTSSLNCTFTRQQLEEANAKRQANLKPAPPSQPPIVKFNYSMLLTYGGVIIVLIILLTSLRR